MSRRDARVPRTSAKVRLKTNICDCCRVCRAATHAPPNSAERPSENPANGFSDGLCLRRCEIRCRLVL
ncbi:hypothetical protein [Kingella potus]|uniref:hypothetical protein n=1 Tax=Kingella potus TaxID=265175 RepID=UPI001FCFF43B|nr:hypothetical protein [Kingella potus]UOO99941.1 hypothetical protein LVJ84_07705 [Kingella potus]